MSLRQSTPTASVRQPHLAWKHPSRASFQQMDLMVLGEHAGSPCCMLRHGVMGASSDCSGAGQDVGRSCVVLHAEGTYLMFDCGMHLAYKDGRR